MKREMRRSGAPVNYTQRNYMQGNYHKSDYNSKKQYRDDASNYYMHTANAVARDYQYEEEVHQTVQKIRKPKKKSTPVLAHHISTVFVVFLLGFVLVGQYAYIQNLGYQVSQTKNELKTVQVQNEKIKKEIASIGELQTVEISAVSNMGMHEPEEWEIIYLPKSTDTIEKSTEEEKADDGVADKVKEVLGTIIH